MGKQKIKLGSIIATIISLMIGLAIGGSFVSGLFSGVFLLNLLPLIIHQIVGWIIIVGTLLSVVLMIIGK